MFIGADADITDDKTTDELISQINMYRVSDREVTAEDMDFSGMYAVYCGDELCDITDCSKENIMTALEEAIQEIKEKPAPYACSGVIDGSFIFAGLAVLISAFVIWWIAVSRKEKAGQ